MKKSLVILLSVLLLVGSVVPIMAEGEDFSDKASWTAKCSTANLTDAEQKQCALFVQSMSDESSSLRDQLAAIEAKRETIAANIAEYGKKISGYETEIKTLNVEIATLNEQIAVKEAEIVTKEAEIVTKEAEVEQLKQKVMHRMVAGQSGMRLNQYIDIIMGAKNLNDLVRRTNGIKDITDYDESEREKLRTLIDELNVAKAEIVATKEILVTDKASVVSKQEKVILMKKEVEVAIQESKKQEAELEAEGNRIAGNIAGIKAALAALSSSIANIPNSLGFVRPVSGGKVTAGTWYYPASFGGGVHLGIDYAPGRGSSIFAAGNGVVIKSVDGCGEGGIGNGCGASQGGSYGGGNQIYLLTKINGTLYAIKYLHMQAGSPIAQNKIVNSGDYIGQVGNSGNSTGPHCHVEVFKLGTMDINDYIASWNGDLAFGTGWGASAIGTTCESRGAPCRVRPESVF